MSKDLTVPELGENIDTATVVEVFVKSGDTVDKDQAVLSLETDKAQFELPATDAGTVAEVLVSAGDDVRVGQAVLRLSGDGGTSKAAAKPAKSEASKPDGDGAKAAKSSDAAAPTSATRDAAKTKARDAKGRDDTSGDDAERGERDEADDAAPAQARDDAGDGRAKTRDAQPAAPKDDAKPRPTGAIAAAPSVRRLARELGVSLEAVAAETGDGRVTAADVRTFKERGTTPAPAAAAPATPGWPAPAPLPDFSKWGEIEIQEMTKIRRKTAENMARAWVEIPTVTHHDEADITKLDTLRKRYAARVKESGGSLTWTAILLHVVAGALRRFPQFNASVDMAQSRIIYKKYVHIGVAVDTERGLLVPVIRDVDQKNIAQLAKDLADVSEAARSRNIKPDMMQGATFTITNLGGVGGVAFNPIVNPPQVAILGVSRGSIRPIWRDEKFVPRQILPLSLSYDHRVIDGADAARFLRWTCEALEEPFLLDLEGQ